MRHLLVLSLPLALALAACKTDPPKESTWDPGEDTDTDTDVDTDTDTDTDTDAEEGPIGVVVVVHWPEDRAYAASSYAHAVFSTDPSWSQLVDPLGALSWEGVDAFLSWQGWLVPGEGGTNDTFDTDPGFDVLGLETLDAGDRLLIGSMLESYRTEQSGLVFYDSDPEDEVLEDPFVDGPLDLHITGGADVGEATIEGAIPAPDAVALTSHDPLEMQVVGADEDFTLTWTPSGDPDATMLVTVAGGFYAQTWGVADDDGEFTLSAEALQDQGGDALVLTVARMVESEVALDEGVLIVRSLHESWSQLVQVEDLGFSPPRIFTGRSTVVELYRADGVFDTDLVVDAGEGVYQGAVSVIDGGHTARVVLDVDEDAEAEFRDLTVTTGGETLLAPSQLGVYRTLEGGETCDEGAFLPPLSAGFHFDPRDGRTSSSGILEGCESGLDYIGADSFHRFSLREGETLTVSAYWEEGDGVVALLDGCGGDLIVCFDDADELSPEVLEWTADEDREVIVVFDESLGYDDADLYAVFDVAAAVDLYLEADPLQGTSETILVDNRSFDFIDGEPVFDFGTGVTVDAVRVPGGTGPTAEVDVSVASDAPVGDRAVTVAQGGDIGSSRVGDFRVTGLLAASDDCGTADSVGALVTGRYAGTTVGTTDLGIDTVACGPTEMPAGDAVYRVELPSAGDSISASVTAPFDSAIYLVSACDGRPVACIDRVAAEDTELFNWTAGAGEGGTYYLVVDGRDPGDEAEFTLDVRVP